MAIERYGSMEEARNQANRNILACSLHIQNLKRYGESSIVQEFVQRLALNMETQQEGLTRGIGWSVERRLRGDEENRKYPKIDLSYKEIFEQFNKELILGEVSLDSYKDKDTKKDKPVWAGLDKWCEYPEAKELLHNSVDEALIEWDRFKTARKHNYEEIFEDFFLFWVDVFTGKRKNSNLDFHYCFGLSERLGQAIREWFRIRITCYLRREDLIPWELIIFSTGTKVRKTADKYIWQIKIYDFLDEEDLIKKLHSGDFQIVEYQEGFTKESLVESEEWDFYLNPELEDVLLEERMKFFIKSINSEPSWEDENLYFQFRILD